MGVAPPEALGRISSVPPWFHAGNIDNKEFVVGATLYIPVKCPRRVVSGGRRHAGQGNGEVDITALETLKKRFVRPVVAPLEPGDESFSLRSPVRVNSFRGCGTPVQKPSQSQ